MEEKKEVLQEQTNTKEEKSPTYQDLNNLIKDAIQKQLQEFQEAQKTQNNNDDDVFNKYLDAKKAEDAQREKNIENSKYLGEIINVKTMAKNYLSRDEYNNLEQGEQNYAEDKKGNAFAKALILKAKREAPQKFFSDQTEEELIKEMNNYTGSFSNPYSAFNLMYKEAVGVLENADKKIFVPAGSSISYTREAIEELKKNMYNSSKRKSGIVKKQLEDLQKHTAI